MMLGLTLSPAAARPAGRWWPDGAVFAADFINRRYMRHGAEVSEGEAFTFNRASPAWSTATDGSLVAHGINEPRFGPGGLLLEAARTRLSLGPVQLATSQWSNSSGAVSTPLPPEGLFAAPVRIASGGFDFSRRVSAPMELTAGTPVHIKVRYRAGTSPNFGVYMRSNAANLQSVVSGPVGSLTSLFTSGGAWSDLLNTSQTTWAEVEATFTPASTQPDWQLGLSPRSAVVGETVEVLAAEVLNGAGPSSWILGDPNAPTNRNEESIVITSLPAAASVSIDFDGTPFVATVVGSSYVVQPSSLGRVVRSVLSTV